MNLHKLYKKASAAYKSMLGKAQHASNYDYNIIKAVYMQLQAGELSAQKLLPKLDNKQQEKLLELVCAMANKRRAGHPPEPAEIEEIKNCIAENMPAMTTEFLDRIEQIALASGLFAAAYAARERNEAYLVELAQKRAVPQKLTKRAASKLFWSLINRGDDETILALRRGGLHYDALCIALGLLPKAPLNQKTPEHAAFADYVKGKNIAVLGPSSEGFDHSEEIKRDFDIIIRMNYSGVEKLPEAQRSLAPHISYYSGDHRERFFETLGEDIDISYLKDLDFAVLKRLLDKTRQNMQKHTTPREPLLIEDCFFFMGKHNMVQIILQDLLCFEPSRIKVFYSNLFLSEALHDKGYKVAGYKRDTLASWHDSSKHNRISQYDYVRALYKRGLIEADTRLKEVLDLGTAEYISQMEKQEGKKDI